MRHSFAVIIFLGICAQVGGQVLYSENFDSFATGSRIALNDSAHWRTWNDAPGSVQDPLVVDTPFQSSARALGFVQTMPGSAGGPERVLWLLGDLTAGAYVITWYMYVPSGKGAGFLLYNSSDLSTADPCILVSMHANGSMEVYVQGAVINATFQQDVWSQISIAADIGLRTATLYVDAQAITTWALDVMVSGTPTFSGLGSLYFPAGTFNNGEFGEYYLDDVVLTEGNVGISMTRAEFSGSLIPSPNPGTGQFVLELSLPRDLEPQGDLLLQVFDAHGRLVISMDLGPAMERTVALDLSEEPAGLYTVHLSDAQRILTGVRLIVN